mgnify:CR=1 FL=1
MKNEVTKQIRVYGIVQGVGFRPTVSRHAATHQIRGSVSNKGPYVEIFAQGPEEAVDGFISDIENKPPKRAAILKMNIEPVEEAEDFTEFAIIESEKTKGEIFVSPDIAICDECKEEMFDPKNRRYLHPFINCTCCGPRLTILDALPYDRERTSMKEFPMCPECEAEIDYEIGPDESLEDVLDTAVLLEKIEGSEEVEKMDALLSLAITGGDDSWI